MLMVALPQVSVAVGVLKVQSVPHSTVMLLTQLITGGVRSSTVTVWLHSAVLPQAPVRLVTVPTMVMVTEPQLSVAVGALNDQALPHSTVLFGAQVMVGGV